MTNEINQSDRLLALSLKQASRADVDDLWRLFQRYHEEVSSHLGEQLLGTEENFKRYWMPSENRVSFLLIASDIAIGFVLTQIVPGNGEQKMPVLEVGAIYVVPHYRLGCAGLNLYEAVLAVATSQRVPIASEVALGNGHSLRLIKALTRRYRTRIRDIQILPPDNAMDRYMFRCVLAGEAIPKPLEPRS